MSLTAVLLGDAILCIGMFYLGRYVGARLERRRWDALADRIKPKL